METVEVVIRIPKKDMETINDPKGKGKMQDNMESYRKMIQIADRVFLAVENGTVLPKGHDALLDAGQLMDYCHNQIEGHKYVDCNVIARFPCVVKSDRGDTDGNS